MSDIAALTDRADYLARVATTAAESVAGLDAQAERLAAELATTKEARKLVALEAKEARAAADAADADLEAALAAPLVATPAEDGPAVARAGVAEGRGR